MRIVVRPGGVEVVAPRFARRGSVESFVRSKREWIFRKTEALRELPGAAIPERFVSGARILFRGRRLALHVAEDGSGARAAGRRLDETPAGASVRFANAFHVTVPAGLTRDEREGLVARLVKSWFARRALADAGVWVREHGPPLGVRPARIRIGNQKTLWGSCSAKGVVSLNWRLVQAPRRVFEYVVVHELCHLVERNHGPRFWELVASRLPDHRDRRAWLARRGVALG